MNIRKKGTLFTTSSLFTLFFSLSFMFTPLVYGQSAGKLAVTISPQETEFDIFEPFAIPGRVTFLNGTGAPAYVAIRIFRGSTTYLDTSTIADEDGEFLIKTAMNDAGTFIIAVNATYSNEIGNAQLRIKTYLTPSTVYNRLNLWILVLPLIVGLIFYIIILLSRRLNLSGASIVVSLIIIFTVFTFAPIVWMLYADLQVGVSSVIGITTSKLNDQMQWVVNIGGVIEGDSYVSGVQIPVYIIVLGLVGAYIRFMYSIRNDASKLLESEGISRKCLNYLIYFLEAPVLAIVTYFILWQFGTKETVVLSFVSLSVGLLIKEIEERMRTLAKELLSSKD